MTGVNVYEAALARIRWVFDEFPEVVINSSGGKDSTVVVHLALKVAEEKGRLPLKVMWIDQEHEYRATVEYQRKLFALPGVEPYWYQIPFRLFNATSPDNPWHDCWDEAHPEDWARAKEPGAITVNDFGDDRFTKLLDAVGDRLAPGGAVLTGVRAEESPTRRFGLMTYPSYKWVTWGRKTAPGHNHQVLHPIYDWTFGDVWHAIAVNGWDYCTIYDDQYRYGVPTKMMRVSNYHHETAVHNLLWLQEIEPDTWEKATKLPGVNTAGMIQDDFWVHDLPFMFRSWREYRDYLIEHITPEEHRAKFHHKFALIEKRLHWMDPDDLAHKEVQTVLANDTEMTKMDSVEAAAYQKRSQQINEQERQARAAATQA